MENNKPDFIQEASKIYYNNHELDTDTILVIAMDHVWNTHVVPLQEKNKALKIDASNWAYQCDRAKQDRDKAEFENQALREEVERLKAEQKGIAPRMFRCSFTACTWPNCYCPKL